MVEKRDLEQALHRSKTGLDKAAKERQKKEFAAKRTQLDDKRKDKTRIKNFLKYADHLRQIAPKGVRIRSFKWNDRFYDEKGKLDPLGREYRAVNSKVKIFRVIEVSAIRSRFCFFREEMGTLTILLDRKFPRAIRLSSGRVKTRISRPNKISRGNILPSSLELLDDYNALEVELDSKVVDWIGSLE